MPDLDSCLEIAKSASLLAGNFLKEKQDTNLKILSNKARDLKLQIDIDAEEIIKEYITANSSLPILAEESGISGSLDDYFWVVDPLDGTSNFLRNIPISCVSIALVQGLKPILGAIFDFNNSDLYFAHKNSKAFVNNSEINVSSLNFKKDSTFSIY